MYCTRIDCCRSTEALAAFTESAWPAKESGREAVERTGDLRQASSNRCTALVAHDLAPGGLRVHADSLRHVIAVEAQARQQLRVVPPLVCSQGQHEAPARHAGSKAHLCMHRNTVQGCLAALHTDQMA